jgi:hypothetical protein
MSMAQMGVILLRGNAPNASREHPEYVIGLDEMKTTKVILIRSKGYADNEVSEICNFLKSFEGPLRFVYQKKPLPVDPELWKWRNLFDEMDLYREQHAVHDDDFLVLLTNRPNQQNWFSAFSPKGRNIFVQTSGWENYVFADSRYPIIYEILANILQKMSYGTIPALLTHAHKEPIGCVNDVCQWKLDITFKLRTADICNDCVESASRAGVSKELLKEIVSIYEALRKEMVFNKTYQEKPDFTKRLLFPIAVTKEKLASTTEPLRKFLFLIDHFDSMVRTSVIFLARTILSDSKLKQFLAKKGLLEKPSLGHWVGALQFLAKAGNDSSSSIRFPADFQKRVHKIVSLANKKDVVKLRNEERGHGYVSCHDIHYKSKIDEYSPIIAEIEGLLLPMFYDLSLVFVAHSEKIDKSTYQCNFLDLSGSKVIFDEKISKITTTRQGNVPISKRLYIYSGDREKWFDVEPYMVYRECPKCQHPRILIADGETYLDPLMGHLVKL